MCSMVKTINYIYFTQKKKKKLPLYPKTTRYIIMIHHFNAYNLELVIWRKINRAVILNYFYYNG
jgi:hypothetical protein